MVINFVKILSIAEISTVTSTDHVCFSHRDASHTESFCWLTEIHSLPVFLEFVEK